MRRIILFALALAAGGAVAVLTHREAAPPAADVDVAAEPSGAAQPVVDAAGQSETPPPAETDLVAVSGRIEVDDGGQGWLDHLSGMLSLGYETRSGDWVADPREWIQVRVVYGHWSARIPKGARFRGEDAMLGERAIGFEGVVHTAPDDGFVVLCGRFTDIAVSIVDGRTGADLEDVTLLSVYDSDAESLSYQLLLPFCCGHIRTIRRGADSPLHLTTAEVAADLGFTRDRLFAHAEGYGWRCFEVALHPPRDLTVELYPAASLAVTIESLPLELPTVLRVRSQRDGPAAESGRGDVMLEYFLDPAETAVVLEELTPMALHISVETGRHYHERRITYAGQNVTLVAGRETAITLRCAPPPELPAKVPLAGTLFVPLSWGKVWPSLSFEMINRPADVDGAARKIGFDQLVENGAPGLFRWDAGEVLPGDHEVFVDLNARSNCVLPRCAVIHVGPEGSVNERIDVPEAADLIVRILCSCQGESRLGHVVYCHAARPSMRGMALGCFAAEDQLQLPAGPMWISAVCFGDEGERRNGAGVFLDLEPGQNEVTLDIRGTACLRLRLTEDGSLLPYHWRDHARDDVTAPFPLDVRPLDGGGRITGWNYDDFFFSAPGSYEVTLDPLDGYLPPEPRVVTLAAGQITTLNIELLREQ